MLNRPDPPAAGPSIGGRSFTEALSPCRPLSWNALDPFQSPGFRGGLYTVGRARQRPHRRGGGLSAQRPRRQLSSSSMPAPALPSICCRRECGAAAPFFPGLPSASGRHEAGWPSGTCFPTPHQVWPSALPEAGGALGSNTVARLGCRHCLLPHKNLPKPLLPRIPGILDPCAQVIITGGDAAPF